MLIVTIDEKEYLRLGLLLEQIYPEARIQMVSSLINPASMPRHSTFGRIDEYIFYVFLGSSAPVRMQLDEEWVSSRGRTFTGKIRWDLILQSGPASQREDSPAGFYPVYIDPDGPKIAHVGEALPLGESRESVANETEWHALWPIRKNGTEGRWRLGSETLRERLALGHVRVGGNEKRGFTLYYLTPAEVAKIEDGTYKVIGRRPDGSPVTSESESRPSSVPTTQWRISSHDATQYGSRLLAKIMPDRKFPYPKSLYAVEDSLRFIVADKPDAIILDFFAGSGTTAHAVMRLNERDGGRRQCISVTNNEVAADEHKTLREAGLRPGDAEWEKLGICDYITKPRVKSAITGITPDGEPIDGEYKFGNRSEVEKPRRFYHIAFADHNSLKKTAAKRQLVSLIDDLPQSLVSKIESYIVSDKYDAAVLFDPQEKERWLYALEGQNHIRDIYIVTPDVAQFKDLRDEVSDLLGPIVVSEEHEVPMAQGFEENAEFFTLTYETPVGVNYQTAFARIAPLLWLRAGSVGQRIDKLPAAGWGVEDAYGLLIDLDKGTEFLRAIRKADNLRIVYIVTDDERRFQSLSRRLPDGVEAIRLYESYLSNFAFANGDEA